MFAGSRNAPTAEGAPRRGAASPVIQLVGFRLDFFADQAVEISPARIEALRTISRSRASERAFRRLQRIWAGP